MWSLVHLSKKVQSQSHWKIIILRVLQVAIKHVKCFPLFLKYLLVLMRQSVLCPFSVLMDILCPAQPLVKSEASIVTWTFSFTSIFIPEQSFKTADSVHVAVCPRKYCPGSLLVLQQLDPWQILRRRLSSALAEWAFLVVKLIPDIPSTSMFRDKC